MCVCPLLYFTGDSWSTFLAHVVVEQLCGSEPTAPTFVVGSWRLIDCFAPRLGSKGFLGREFSPLINPTASPCWWAQIRAKQLSVAATAGRYGCVHAWGRCMCAPCFKLHYFQQSRAVQKDRGPWEGDCTFKVMFALYTIELTVYFSSTITVFHDICKQIQQRARKGKIFARWHLAIAITSVVKTEILGFLLIIQWNLVLCMTKFLDTLLQPISKSQKSYLSLKRQMWRTEHFFFRWMLYVSLDTAKRGY